MFVNEKDAKSCFKFYCEKCHYGTMRKSSMDKHMLSSKHLKSIFVNEKDAKSCDLSHICENCKKTYKEPSGLWRHKKKCNNKKNINISTNENDKQKDELINYLIKENQEFKSLILEIVKKDTTTNNNITNNKTFNLNVF